jgi:hypothetical protein
VLLLKVVVNSTAADGWGTRVLFVIGIGHGGSKAEAYRSETLTKRAASF